MCENEDIDDISTKIPVTNMHYNLTFRNKYCAECHGYSDEPLYPWDLQIACNNATISLTKPITIQDLFQKILKSVECNIFFYPQEWFPLFDTCKRYISACNITGHWKTYNRFIDTACNSYIAPYYFKYKNIFCYMCNADETGIERCTGDYTYDDKKLTLSMVLKYNVFEEMNLFMPDEKKPSNRCPRNAIFDRLQVFGLIYFLHEK
jgi:hypothetical protein